MQKRLKMEVTSIPKGATNLEAKVVNDKVFVYFDYEVDQSYLEEIKGSKEWLDKYFPVVHASSLFMQDKILRHKPESLNQVLFKKRVEDAINSGLENFRAQRMDASIGEDGGICFKSGLRPANGKSAVWWDLEASHFLPQKHSRLGLTKERVAFLALVMKELVDSGQYDVKDVWKAVCDQSRDIAHCSDSYNARKTIELTGSRLVGNWNDLGNLYKITVNKNGSFELTGSFYGFDGNVCSLSFWMKDHHPGNFHRNSIGWVVMDV